MITPLYTVGGVHLANQFKAPLTFQEIFMLKKPGPILVGGMAARVDIKTKTRQ